MFINGGTTLSIGQDNTSTTFSGTLQDGGTGSGSLAKLGSGTLTLSGTNTYSGGTLINGGTLSVSADNNLGNSTGGVTFAGGTLQITSSFGTSRPITLDTGGGSLVNSSGSPVGINGNISGSGSLTLEGVFTFGGTNTYTGPTLLNPGGGLIAARQALFRPQVILR